MTTLSEIDAMLKSQKVRAFDIYALGPFMIWYAMKSKGVNPWAKRALFASGVMTIVYNWTNYRKAQAILTEEVKQWMPQ